MKIHEYQAKELFRKYDVPVPEGGVAFTPEEAVGLAETLGGYPVVVKARSMPAGAAKAGASNWPNPPEKSKALPGR